MYGNRWINLLIKTNNFQIHRYAVWVIKLCVFVYTCVWCGASGSVKDVCHTAILGDNIWELQISITLWTHAWKMLYLLRRRQIKAKLNKYEYAETLSLTIDAGWCTHFSPENDALLNLFANQNKIPAHNSRSESSFLNSKLCDNRSTFAGRNRISLQYLVVYFCKTSANNRKIHWKYEFIEKFFQIKIFENVCKRIQMGANTRALTTI